MVAEQGPCFINGCHDDSGTSHVKRGGEAMVLWVWWRWISNFGGVDQCVNRAVWTCGRVCWDHERLTVATQCALLVVDAPCLHLALHRASSTCSIIHNLIARQIREVPYVGG